MANEKLIRPGPSSSPCLAVLGKDHANLRLVSLNGETSDVLKIPFGDCRDIVTVGGQVYVLGDEDIWKINSNGKITSAIKLDGHSLRYAVSFKDTIYVIQSNIDKMIRFDPADKTTNYDLPGCKLGVGFCCCVSDKFIYAMGGWGTRTSAMKYDPLTNMWTVIAPMKHMRLNSAAAATSNRIYVLGGEDNSPPEFYDPQTSAWNEMSKMNASRRLFSACVINDQLYAVGGDWDDLVIWGGSRRKSKQQQSVEIFDRDQWKVVTKFELKSKWGVVACVWPHGSSQPDCHAELDRSRKVFPKKASHTNHSSIQEPMISGRMSSEGSLPETDAGISEGTLTQNKKASHAVTNQDENIHEDPKSSQSDASRVTTKDLWNDVTNGIKNHLANQDPIKSEPVGRKGGDVHLPDTYIKVSEGALARNAKVSFSTRTVTDQEDGLIDVAPRLLIDSSVEFSIPVSVKMNTTVSGTAADPIPVAIHQRDNPREEWRETEQLDVGEENEIDYKVYRGGETKVTISRNTKLKKIHAKEDFFINRKTGLVAASFSTDTNIRNATIKTLAERNFPPFDVCPHQFASCIGTKVTPNISCRDPKEISISQKVYPDPEFLVDRDFLEQGSRFLYYEFKPEQLDQFEKISLDYQCKLNEKLNHELLLKWRRSDEKQNEGKGKNAEAISANDIKVEGDGSNVDISGTVNPFAGNKGENAKAKTNENAWTTTIGVAAILISVAVLVLAIALERFFLW